MTHALKSRCLAVLLVLLSAAGCVTRDEPTPTSVLLSVEEAARRIPERVKDRRGWASDIIAAIDATDHEPTAERVCAVMAIIEQESGYVADPPVANLPHIVREGLLKKLTRLGPLAEPALAALLAGKAPGSNVSFARRIDRMRTERDLDRFFRDVEAAYRDKLPGTFVIAAALSRILGKGRLQDLNPVTTAGSMQVKVSYASTLEAFSGLDEDALRERLYSRAGGVLAGTYRLIGYPAGYDDISYRFADYNAGVYSSRNAAFQEQLSLVSGHPLALDGDLQSFDGDGQPKDSSRSLKAMRIFARQHDIWDWTVDRAFAAEKNPDFEDTSVWDKVRAAWQDKTGRPPAYARMPIVELISPKLSHARTTAWYAASVRKRYDACRGVN